MNSFYQNRIDFPTKHSTMPFISGIFLIIRDIAGYNRNASSFFFFCGSIRSYISVMSVFMSVHICVCPVIKKASLKRIHFQTGFCKSSRHLMRYRISVCKPKDPDVFCDARMRTGAPAILSHV